MQSLDFCFYSANMRRWCSLLMEPFLSIEGTQLEIKGRPGSLESHGTQLQGKFDFNIKVRKGTHHRIPPATTETNRKRKKRE